MGHKNDKKKRVTRKQQKVIDRQSQSANSSCPNCPNGPTCRDCLDPLPYPEEFLPSVNPTSCFSLHELFTKRSEGINSLKDIEEVINFEFRFLEVIGQIISQTPLSQRAIRTEQLDEYESLREDLKIVMKWRDQQSMIHFSLKDKISEIEKSFKPHPNFEILSVIGFHDDTFLSLSEDIPEIDFRVRQGYAYFHQIIDTHCRIPREFTSSEKKFFGCDSAPEFFYFPRARIPSRNYIFAPGSTQNRECIRYMKFFLTSVIRENNIPPLLPYVPLNREQPMPLTFMIDGVPLIAEFPDSLVD